ncbi:hypothetical protein AB0F73_10125 [Micromonospora purpureochromogenes]|uniref:hypothetical protein n=1 Tax=Micromonospora purpureochromogenes TaxID=47872 RepID=UPI0033F33C74
MTQDDRRWPAPELSGAGQQQFQSRATADPALPGQHPGQRMERLRSCQVATTPLREKQYEVGHDETARHRSELAERRTGDSRVGHRRVCVAAMSPDPTGQGRRRWTMRWKSALNAFDERHRRAAPFYLASGQIGGCRIG